MSQMHMYLGIAVLAGNAAAGITGALLWLRNRLSNWFWYLLRVAQASVAVQVATGLILLARGETTPDGLHIAYGVAPLVISLVSEGMRVGAAQRELDDVEDLEGLDRSEQIAIARRVARSEMGVMTVGALLILTLALRAFQTGGS
ncbi:MAG: hypothetical protein ACR2F4_06590 [Thermoleophilaceae bacterium]|nr:hypothetical protein [Thermoleophilaceae bacterium]MDQ3433358.1 hypothetical protein [Actinomycetota bacterium]